MMKIIQMTIDDDLLAEVDRATEALQRYKIRQLENKHVAATNKYHYYPASLMRGKLNSSGARNEARLYADPHPHVRNTAIEALNTQR